MNNYIESIRVDLLFVLGDYAQCNILISEDPKNLIVIQNGITVL